MDWIGTKMDWIKKIRFFAHPYNKECFEPMANPEKRKKKHFSDAVENRGCAEGRWNCLKYRETYN